ncbi:MAG TPA: sensor histidine kinase [Candidatus Pseudogracilibacillus intestinigallinarum]|uniref:Signal transduction histidine-protein kinase/phosphatase DegS n=1 Tax=Candidatus Pseudogracilibacillus intestinigallinarum TaxID=2838742 RepID=A0A9D1TJW7_9BACI|nr:sensor histidine kinase [Candidatus Pseudogracilibacillus intestinigallinarum]
MASDKRAKERTLDMIVEEMKSVVEKTKDDIFDISEEAISELEALERKLATIKKKILDYIKAENILTREVQASRQKLLLVSREFDTYSEDDIRETYEHTHEMQSRLAINHKEEKLLRQQRDEVERRIIRLNKTVHQANDLGRKVSVVLSYLHDDFNELNEVLKTAKEKQQIGLKIIEAQELERKRLSRDIHDGPAQMLANILLRSEIIDLSVKGGNITEAVSELKNVRGNIRSVLREVRRIIYDLRPMALDDLGIIPTVKKHVSTMAETYNTHIELQLIGEEKRLESNYEVAVFRLIQESLQNALKHAEATSIYVTLQIEQDEITIVVQDNGKGFRTDETKNSSFGLMGMKERVEMLNGHFQINSTLGKGTTIKIILPYIVE